MKPVSFQPQPRASQHQLGLRLGLLPLSLVVACAVVLAGCKPHGPATGAPPPQVTVAPVEQRDVIEWDEFTGRAEAVERVEVRPRVSGHIQEVRFQSGQLVRKGDVLFVIDPRWHQAEFQRRQAEYDQAAVRAENAEREAARTGLLLEKKAISTEEGEQRQSRYREAAAGLLAAEAARDSAKLDLEFTEIRSPIDGRVSRALVTAGNYVSGTAGAATMLTTIVSVDPIYVYADVDENSLLKFNQRRRESNAPSDSAVPVELQLADEEGFVHHGRIESFDNRLDAQSGSIVLRAVFSNPDGRIVPGLFARVRLPGGTKAPALLVEETAIGTDQAQKFVLTLTSTNTAAYRQVKLGPVIDGKRVVREGLRAGEKIVINGLARVRPGMPVAPVEGAVSGGAPQVAAW
jgi:RND family efflux transporter MFP subunit